MIFNDVGGGVGGTANYNTFQYASENSDASASITKVWGKHEISTGLRIHEAVPECRPAAGAFGLVRLRHLGHRSNCSNSAVGGSDFASLLIGMGTTPGSESNSYPNFTKDLFAAEANPYYAAFVEDTYRPIKSFTITAGLRWDIFGGKTERHNRLEYFDPKAANTVSGVSYTGAEIYVSSGSRSPFATNLADFGPRLGFSWQPIHSLVVRGGGGFYYGPSPHMVGGTGLNSDGFSANTTWNATDWNQDPNTIAYDCPDPDRSMQQPGQHRDDQSAQQSVPEWRGAAVDFAANGTGRQSRQFASTRCSTRSVLPRLTTSISAWSTNCHTRWS